MTEASAIKIHLVVVAVCLVLTAAVNAVAVAPEEASEWTIYVTNDNCPDYTWGLTEEQTRQSFADIVRAHLDEMNLTDSQESHNRDRYNMAVTQEALCFVERYPERKDELIRRIREGRIFVSPYLCNSMWAFQGIEGAIRTLYPARRLEKEWGISIDVAEHIEQPCLPWGVASILSGCGIRWVSIPYYGYDSTFEGLKNQPLFILEGPDGSKVRVIMDKYASSKSSYTQGGHILRNPDTVAEEWLPHYKSVGEVYPLQVILASGTHGDISPGSGSQAHGFAEAIIKYNAQTHLHPKLVNAILPQFCQVVDEVEAKTSFLPTIRGCFGHSWDLWPVSLAKYVADMREGERVFLAAEALLSVAAYSKPELHQSTRSNRWRAEWCLSMLADHAWNGTNDNNKRHNAELRRKWSEELNRLGHKLVEIGWSGVGLEPSERYVTIFNSLSFPRKSLVRIKCPKDVNCVVTDQRNIPCQIVDEDGEQFLYFVSPQIPAFSFKQFQLKSELKGVNETENKATTPHHRTSGGSVELKSPYYLLKVDTQNGGISSIVHKATGTEIVISETGRDLCQTIYFDGQEHSLQNIQSEIAAGGPVLVRLKITGNVDGIEVTNFVTMYAELDQADFDLRMRKPITTKQERLCQVFPVLNKGAVLRIETTGAVIRPRSQPEGDLLAGADTRRFAVQGFIDASLPDGVGVTIAPLDAYALRMDLDPITFEALGNDQNYREVTRDQDGVTNFRFRYALQAHTGGYRSAKVFGWSRSVATPMFAALGRIPEEEVVQRGVNPPDIGQIEVDAARAIATCLKQADGDIPEGFILRIWEVAGLSEPISIGLKGYNRAILTDLLERDRKELKIVDKKVIINPNSNGFCSLRLVP